MAARALSSVGYVGSCLSSPVIRNGRIAGFALPTTTLRRSHLLAEAAWISAVSPCESRKCTRLRSITIDAPAFPSSTAFRASASEDPANLVATAGLDLHLPAALLPALFRRVVAAYHQGLNDGGWSWDRAEAERAIRLALVVRFAWVLPDLLRATADGRAVLGGRPLTEVAGPWEAVAWLVADAASALRDAGRAGW